VLKYPNPISVKPAGAGSYDEDTGILTRTSNTDATLTYYYCVDEDLSRVCLLSILVQPAT